MSSQINHGSKYRAVKVAYDGITFDSKKEYERYLILKDMQKHGEISGLIVHEPIPLYPKVDGFPKVTYEADFIYKNKKGEMVIEDVKGMRKGTPYQLFKLKKRMVYELYRIIITEV